MSRIMFRAPMNGETHPLVLTLVLTNILYQRRILYDRQGREHKPPPT